MNGHLRANLWLLGLTLGVCCVLYPLTLWVAGQVLFPSAAEGSLLRDDKGKVRGSRLIAQPFSDAKYFQPRPSATAVTAYNAAASGGSNLAASNPSLRFRVARQLGPMVRYSDDSKNGDRRGQAVGPFIEQWFPRKDRVAGWAKANQTAASDWVKTDDNTKKYVTEWTKANADVLERWKKDNPEATEAPDPEKTPEALAVQFFASYAAKHPRTFPGLKEVKTPDGKMEKQMRPVTTGSDLQGVFFDLWLQEHPDADLLKVPADMVMASGSGLDPHITLRNARYQLDGVVEARAKVAERSQGEVRETIEDILKQHAFTPLAGLVGEPLVNVLEVNRALDAEPKLKALR